MKHSILLFVTLCLMVSSAVGAPKSGHPAPDFTGTTSNGETLSLGELEGKYVVLEWLNHGCPFVVKHYESGNMQRLQEKMTAEGVVWLSVVSSAEGKQGYQSPESTNEKAKAVGSKASHIVIDASGAIGRAYAARTTPHMYVIDPSGVLIYQGAIDSISSVRQSDIGKAENYVWRAWKAHQAGDPVDPHTTAAYGCAIKY